MGVARWAVRCSRWSGSPFCRGALDARAGLDPQQLGGRGPAGGADLARQPRRPPAQRPLQQRPLSGLPGITATTPAEVRQNIEQMRRVYDLRRETEEAITGIEVLVERTNGQRFLRIYSIRD